MTHRKLSMLFALFVFSPTCIANAVANEGDVRLRLNPAGVNAVALEIKNSVLRSIRNEPLPDIDTEVDYGIDVHVSGIRYSVDFTSLEMVPVNGALTFAVGVKNVVIQMDKLEASKRIIVRISTECEDINMRIASNNPIPLQGDLGLNVADGRIRAKGERFSFHVPDSEFDVSGPRHCSGPIGLGGLFRLIVKRVLENSRGRMEDTIRNKVQDASPAVGGMLDGIVRRNIDLASVPFPGLPKLDGYLVATPADLTINTEGIDFGLALEPHKGPSGSRNPGLPLISVGVFGQYGALGLNPKLISSIITNLVVVDGPQTLYVDAASNPELQQALSVSRLAKVWPELSTLQLRDRDLRLAIAFNQAPELEANQPENIIDTEFDNLGVSFQVNRDGWHEFYRTSLDVRYIARATIQGDSLTLALKQGSLKAYRGDWGAEYSPNDRTFVEAEFFEFVGQFLNTASWNSDLISLWVPTLVIGNDMLSFDNPHIDGSFLFVDLVKVHFFHTKGKSRWALKNKVLLYDKMRSGSYRRGH